MNSELERQGGRFKYHPRYLLVSVVALALASVYFTLLHYALNHDFPLAKLHELIEGTAHKPFQFRILVPSLVGILSKLTGIAIIVVYPIIESLALIGLVFSFRYFLRSYFKPPLVDLFAFGIVLLLPWNYLLPREITLVVPSDIPAVMFFTLLLALMARKHWILFYTAFAIATLNRETTCFISVIFLFVHWRVLPWRMLLAHLGGQVVIWAAIKIWLSILYADNPGALFEIVGIGGDSHLVTNLKFLASPMRAMILLSSFGFLWIPVLLWGRWIQDRFLVRALLALIPFLLVMLVIGNLNEIRIFGEWVPLVIAANLLIARRLFLKHEVPVARGGEPE